MVVIKGKKYLSVEEVVGITGLTKAQLSSWRVHYRNTGNFKGPFYIQHGGRPKYSEESVYEYLDSIGA